MHGVRPGRCGLWAVGLLLTLVLPRADLSAQEPQQDSAEVIARGAELFARNCQRCHNPRGPSERDDREWVMIMQHMEFRANMTLDRIRLVRAFLLASNEAAQAPGSIRSALAPPPAPADIDAAMLSRGRQISRTAGGCAACHGPNLDGGPVARSLRDGNWMHGDGSIAAILRSIRNGIEGTAMAAYPGGISDDMAVAVAAYVWSVSQGHTEP